MILTLSYNRAAYDTGLGIYVNLGMNYDTAINNGKKYKVVKNIKLYLSFVFT